MKYFRNTVFNLINGVRSGIPLCCVIRYTIDNNKGLPVAFYRSLECNYNFYAKENNWQYVPCQRCYENKHFITPKRNGVILLHWARGSGKIKEFSIIQQG